MHTGQPHPIVGTPTLVPVPSKIIWPEISRVLNILGMLHPLTPGDHERTKLATILSDQTFLATIFQNPTAL